MKNHRKIKSYYYNKNLKYNYRIVMFTIIAKKNIKKNI